MDLPMQGAWAATEKRGIGMKMCRKICTRIYGGILCENQSSKHHHTPDYCRSNLLILAMPFSVIVTSYAGILQCHTAPFSPNNCVSFPLHVQTSPLTNAFSLRGGTIEVLFVLGVVGLAS